MYDSAIQLLNEKGISTWSQLVEIIKNIPYGRNLNRTDISLVITENKGTCSSKHALLKLVSSHFTNDDVKLIVGIYKMNENNTKIGSVLTENKIEFIPEAHCYLKINGEPFDYTTAESDFEKIRADLLKEIEIEPYQVAEFKVNFHQNYVRNWLKETNSEISFEEIWKIREQCIKNLSM